jgi:hypothetical protein
MRNLATAALSFLLAGGLATVAVAADPIDNCATVLGSISVELRIARDLPPGKRSSYFCAKRYTPLVGASRERVLRALGSPDRTGADGGWSYFFASRHGGVEAGTPELVFRFDGAGQVEAVDCHRTA